MKKIIYTLILFIICSYIVEAKQSLDDIRKGTLETATAYLRKGKYIQYDTYRLSTMYSPEDATSLSPIYTVCSTFMSQIFYNSLGIKIPGTTDKLLDYAYENQNTDNIILYLNDSNTIYSGKLLGSSITSTDIAYNNLKDKLKTGDILVIKRKDNTGHAMFIDASKDEIYVIESSGNEYNYNKTEDSYEKNGSIVRKPLKDKIQIFLNSYNNSIEKEHNRMVTEIAIIRYINDSNEYTLTDSASSRLKYPLMDINKNITIRGDKKTSLISASLDNEITYTITIKNNSNKTYENLKITEEIDPKVKIIDKGIGKLNNKILTFTIPSISPKEEYKVSYTIKIPSHKNLIGTYIISKGYVDKIKNKTITNYINHTLLKEEENKIINIYNKLNNHTKLTNMSFISEIYKDAIGLDISFLNDITIEDIISKDGCTKTDITCREYLKNNQIKKVIIPSLYGYKITENEINTSNIYAYLAWSSNDNDYKERTRSLKEEYLEVGDIIITKDKYYLYLGNNTLAQNNIKVECDTLLNNLVGDTYAIIRPAYLFDRNYEIDNPSTNKNLKLIELITISLITSLSIILTLKNKRLYN